jgi:hypothetical protein
MSELLTLDVVAEILEQFRLAWRARTPEKDLAPTAAVWFESLTGLTAESVRVAAKRAIQGGQHFPRVKEIRESALAFMGRTNAVMAMRTDASPNQCGICGARYEHHLVRRKVLQASPIADGKFRYDEVVEPLVDKQGKPVFVDGKQVHVPVWETVRSPREDIFHDPVKHGVRAEYEHQNSGPISEFSEEAA